MKRKIGMSQIRGKKVSHILYDNKMETLLMTFTDQSYVLISIDGAQSPKFVREDFNKHLIDILMPKHLVRDEPRVAVMPEIPKKKDPFYGQYWGKHVLG
jgi:hypothetical protein